MPKNEKLKKAGEEIVAGAKSVVKNVSIEVASTLLDVVTETTNKLKKDLSKMKGN
jgi:hypothetical protein